MATSLGQKIQNVRKFFYISFPQSIRTVKDNIISIFSKPITQYTILIIFFIALLVIIQVIFETLAKSGKHVPEFLSAADKLLVINFIEWFGVLYGFLLPTILVRVWELFDDIDNTLDREANAVKILTRDLLLLDPRFNKFSIRVLISLQRYSQNVLDFINEKEDEDEEKKTGDEILVNIRKLYLEVFHQGIGRPKESDILIDELLTQLNALMANRGERISLSTQRLFQSLKFLAVVTSIVWLVPFYFLYFQDPKTFNYIKLGLFGWILVVSVTFLVIVILTIIDDLDNPFDGFWMVNIDSWKDLVIDIERQIEVFKQAKTQEEKANGQKEEHNAELART